VESGDEIVIPTKIVEVQFMERLLCIGCRWQCLIQIRGENAMGREEHALDVTLSPEVNPIFSKLPCICDFDHNRSEFVFQIGL
jgi:hypothetical protein